MWINEEETLLEHRNSDTWQLPVVNEQGSYLGNIVAQVVEPQACMVRYFVVYNPEGEGQFLIPAETVVDIDREVQCNIPVSKISQLPLFHRDFSRQEEFKIHAILACSPYWEH